MISRALVRSFEIPSCPLFFFFFSNFAASSGILLSWGQLGAEPKKKTVCTYDHRFQARYLVLLRLPYVSIPDQLRHLSRNDWPKKHKGIGSYECVMKAGPQLRTSIHVMIFFVCNYCRISIERAHMPDAWLPRRRYFFVFFVPTSLAAEMRSLGCIGLDRGPTQATAIGLSFSRILGGYYTILDYLRDFA
jgi:hypothetical protein